jgi:CMP/dCMP kinase
VGQVGGDDPQENRASAGQPAAMKRVICISGDAACGKTTAARLLLERLPGWRVVSSGAVFRDYCARHGYDPQEISSLGDDLHRQVDAEMRRTLVGGQNVIAEARLVGYLSRDLDDALRVFCDCPLPIRAERYRLREPQFSQEEAIQRVAERDAADTANLRHLYGIDYHDRAYYHLVLDTSILSPDEVAERILSAARAGG